MSTVPGLCPNGHGVFLYRNSIGRYGVICGLGCARVAWRKTGAAALKAWKEGKRR